MLVWGLHYKQLVSPTPTACRVTLSQCSHNISCFPKHVLDCLTRKKEQFFFLLTMTTNLVYCVFLVSIRHDNAMVLCSLQEKIIEIFLTPANKFSKLMSTPIPCSASGKTFGFSQEYLQHLDARLPLNNYKCLFITSDA